MAKPIDLSIPEIREDAINRLRKAIQSANLNLLLGSGTSFPAIKTLGNIEGEVHALIKAGKEKDAQQKLFKFTKPLVEAMTRLVSKPSKEDIATLKNYVAFLENLSGILASRTGSILPKQATIFTTNYDLFTERAYDELTTPAKLNDGFNRSPVFHSSFKFSTTEFFNSVYNNGTLYNYKVQIPSINLIKLHGSLNWVISGSNVTFNAANATQMLDNYNNAEKDANPEGIPQYLQRLPIVLPVKDKFRDTILNQVYYDLLRIYANELDKENTLLLVEGFSFADEHIREVTTRALKNPTLKIIIFCHSEDDLKSFANLFSSHNNVEILFSSKASIDFAEFNAIMGAVIPLHAKLDSESLKKAGND